MPMQYEEMMNLKALYVDQYNLHFDLFVQKMLKYFSEVFICSKVEEAVKVAVSNNIDLIITRYELEERSGLDLQMLIKEQKKNIPIILICSTDNSDFLKKCIQYDVTRLIMVKELEEDPGEIITKNIIDTLGYMKHKLILQNDLTKVKKKRAYDETQQKNAAKKQLNAIINDCHMRVVDTPSNNRWAVDVISHSPDITSGDSYSIHDIGDERLFLFVNDSMGKGLSPSLTSLVTVTFINNLVKKSLVFSMENIINEFLDYIKRILLLEEILCIIFVTIDFKKDILEYASFGMPSFLVSKGGIVERYKANNLPIMKYYNNLRIDRIEIKNIGKMLFYSDGLLETKNNKTDMIDNLMEVFDRTTGLRSFINEYTHKCSRFEDIEDDITGILITKFFVPSWVKSFTIQNLNSEIYKMESFIKETLNSNRVNLSETDKTKLTIAFSEAVMNAYEHGNMGIDLMKKHYAVNQGTYEKLLESLECMNAHKKIVAYVEVYDVREKFLTIRVVDDGDGVKQEDLIVERNPLLLCGRGIDVMLHHVDKIFFTKKGNEIILIKRMNEDENEIFI